MRPLTKVPTDDDAPWFAPVPIEKKKLQTMVKNKCVQRQKYKDARPITV